MCDLYGTAEGIDILSVRAFMYMPGLWERFYDAGKGQDMSAVQEQDQRHRQSVLNY